LPDAHSRPAGVPRPISPGFNSRHATGNTGVHEEHRDRYDHARERDADAEKHSIRTQDVEEQVSLNFWIHFS